MGSLHCFFWLAGNIYPLSNLVDWAGAKSPPQMNQQLDTQASARAFDGSISLLDKYSRVNYLLTCLH